MVYRSAEQEVTGYTLGHFMFSREILLLLLDLVIERQLGEALLNHHGVCGRDAGMNGGNSATWRVMQNL